MTLRFPPAALFALLCLVCSPSPSFASGSSVHRTVLERLTCDQARTIVDRMGDVVFRHDKDRMHRVVRDRGYCDHDETIFRFDFDVLDTSGCFVGYTCSVKTSGL